MYSVVEMNSEHEGHIMKPLRGFKRLVKWGTYGSVLVVLALFAYFVLRNNAPCAFKEKYGIPCPMCGGTRAVRCLLTLDFIGAWRYNPYVYALILWLPAYGFCWKKQWYIACIAVSVLNIVFLFGSYAIRYVNGSLFLL